MGYTTPRDIKTRQVKETVIEATDRLFVTEGFRSLTMTNIGAASGISVGSIQHHFGDKEGLLYQYGTQVFKKILAGAPQTDTVTDKVSACLSIVEPFSLYAYFCELMGREFIHGVSTNFKNDIFYISCFKDIVAPAIRAAYDGGYMWAAPEDVQKIEEDMPIICKGTVMLWSISEEGDLPTSLNVLMTRILIKFLHEEKVVDMPQGSAAFPWNGLERDAVMACAIQAGGLLKLEY